MFDSFLKLGPVMMLQKCLTSFDPPMGPMGGRPFLHTSCANSSALADSLLPPRHEVPGVCVGRQVPGQGQEGEGNAEEDETISLSGIGVTPPLHHWRMLKGNQTL